MDIGEQERVIIVEPLEAPDPVEPDLVPGEPERELEPNPAPAEPDRKREPEPAEEPAKQERASSRTEIRTVS